MIEYNQISLRPIRGGEPLVYSISDEFVDTVKKDLESIYTEDDSCSIKFKNTLGVTIVIPVGVVDQCIISLSETI